uniref:Phospholipase A2 n=1 Tax=Anopheles minimus TaxID=112268 RepID=A0A1Y9IVS0_9DIPT
MCGKAWTSVGLRVLFCVLTVVLIRAAVGVKLNDSETQASTGSRDARFLAYGEGLSSEEFSLYPLQWRENDGKTRTDRYDDGGELVRLVEGGSDLTPDPYEVIQVKPYDSGRFGTTTNRYRDEGGYHKLTSSDISRTPLGTTFHAAAAGSELGDTDGYYPATAALQSQEPVVMATAPPLSRVSEFVRGMLQRFGVYQYIEAYQGKSSSSGSTTSSSTSGPTTTGPSGLSSHLQRFIPHRFRPHFVNTAKGLRNIPAQLNDGQLQPAPDDVADGLDTTQTSGSPSGATAGNGGSTTGKTPGTSAGGSSGTISSLFNTFKRKVKAIYPGTVWCGDGNQAKSENDIGFFYLTDTCCRAHDLCPITIAAGEQFNRLKNNGYFTRSHCDCDKQFFNCLKNANTLVSRQIGYTYFNLLKPQCFRYEHPKLNCTKRSKGKCLSYVVDEKQSKQWQWFDNLIF